jgi:hypothetical protein
MKISWVPFSNALMILKRQILSFRNERKESIITNNSESFNTIEKVVFGKKVKGILREKHILVIKTRPVFKS